MPEDSADMEDSESLMNAAALSNPKDSISQHAPHPPGQHLVSLGAMPLGVLKAIHCTLSPLTSLCGFWGPSTNSSMHITS